MEMLGSVSVTLWSSTLTKLFDEGLLKRWERLPVESSSCVQFHCSFCRFSSITSQIAPHRSSPNSQSLKHPTPLTRCHHPPPASIRRGICWAQREACWIARLTDPQTGQRRFRRARPSELTETDRPAGGASRGCWRLVPLSEVSPAKSVG